MLDKHIKENYDNWNVRKQNIQTSEKTKNIYFKEGQLWWCSLGLNIGSESFGKGKNFRRPILIIKKLSSDLCIGLPITSKIKTGTWFVTVKLKSESKCIMLCQIRTLHKKRFQFKIGELNIKDFKTVKEKLENLLELS